jgi:hypothetical protein
MQKIRTCMDFLAMHLFVVQKVGVTSTQVLTLSTTLMLFWFEIEPRLCRMYPGSKLVFTRECRCMCEQR